jgi:Ca-activated chloride channel family protein
MARWPAFLVCAGGATLLILHSVSLKAAEPVTPPTFTVGVDVVSLNLVVTDSQGNPVPTLHASDLVLLEDGVPQEISQFAREQWPIRLSILLDSSGSMVEALPVAKRAAARLVRTLGEGDAAQVARFDRSLKPLQEPTTDKDALVRAIEGLTPSGDTALFNALYVTLKDLAHAHADDLSRRAIVVLTDGEDTASMVTDEQLLDVARRAGVAVYPIGLLTSPPPGQRRETLPTYLLTALARETGGRAYFPRSLGQLASAYDGIARELRTLYGIGYVPRTARSDGSWHRIAIQAHEPNLLLRYRTGYFSPALAPRVVTAGGSR